MISTDEDALICDFAEVYHIYDYKSLPVRTAAAFFVGLRHDSRCKMLLAEQKYTFLEMIAVMIYDKLAWLQWAQTKDGAKGINRPEKLAAKLFGSSTERQENEVKGFSSPEEFEAERRKLLEGGNK